jgi:hypothetical protein
MAEHTQTPWRMSPWHIEEGPSAVRTGKDYPEDFIICTTASDEDAAFIVKAVNNHDAMIQALDDLKMHAIEDGSFMMVPTIEWDAAFARMRDDVGSVNE